MSYAMHRVFCAAPGDLEEERQAFYKVMGEFNETKAMPRGVLFVSVSLPATVFDKRPYQAVLGENIRSCRYYIQLLEDTWGPPQKNFERDYALASKCAADPEMPMQQVAILFKKPLLPQQVEPGVAELRQCLAAENAAAFREFDTVTEYRRHLHDLLSSWLPTVAAAAGA
ncbi:MAG: hypothetical protein ACRD9L_19730 [Bryobacteraceae bacterium]